MNFTTDVTSQCGYMFRKACILRSWVGYG